MRGNNQKNSNIMIKTCIFMSLIIFLLCSIVILCIAFSSDDTYFLKNIKNLNFLRNKNFRRIYNEVK